jgi:hypothetical protein
LPVPAGGQAWETSVTTAGRRPTQRRSGTYVPLWDGGRACGGWGGGGAFCSSNSPEVSDTAPDPHLLTTACVCDVLPCFCAFCVCVQADADSDGALSGLYFVLGVKALQSRRMFAVGGLSPCVLDGAPQALETCATTAGRPRIQARCDPVERCPPIF